MNDQYLKQRRRGWYCRVPVPAFAQEAFGSKEVTRTLHTRDKAEANRRKHAVVGQIHADIDAAVKASQQGPSSVGWLERHLITELELFKAGRTTLDEYQLHQQLLIDQHLKAAGVSETPHPDHAYASGYQQPPEEAHKENLALVAASKIQPGVFMLSTAVEAYIKIITGSLVDATVAERQAILSKLVAFTGDVPVSELNRRTLSAFVDGVIDVNGRARNTVAKDIGMISVFFNKYLISKGHYEGINPVSGMVQSLPKSKRGEAKSRRAWTTEELIGITKGLHKLPNYRDMLITSLMLVWTGMRRGERVALRVGECDTSKWELKIKSRGRPIAASEASLWPLRSNP
jgi:hypothetical protein